MYQLSHSNDCSLKFYHLTSHQFWQPEAHKTKKLQKVFTHPHTCLVNICSTEHEMYLFLKIAPHLQCYNNILVAIVYPKAQWSLLGKHARKENILPVIKLLPAEHNFSPEGLSHPWCHVFKGAVQLKMLIQVDGAVEKLRSMVYLAGRSTLSGRTSQASY